MIEELWLADEILGIIEGQAENPPRALENIKRACESRRMRRAAQVSSDFGSFGEALRLAVAAAPTLPLGAPEPNAHIEGEDAG